MKINTWVNSPCSHCPETPCCNWVPVMRLRINNFQDVCRAMRLLYFRNIHLGLYDSGRWMVYYKNKCRHFDPATTRCLIHSSPQRPAICAEYKAGNCWYQDHFMKGAGLRFIRFNLARFLRLCKVMTYRPDLELDNIPEWEEIVEIVSPLPLEEEAYSRNLKTELALYGCKPVTIYPDDLDCCACLFFRTARKPEVTERVNSFQSNFPGLKLRSWESGTEIILRTDCRFASPHGCLLLTGDTFRRGA